MLPMKFDIVSWFIFHVRLQASRLPQEGDMSRMFTSKCLPNSDMMVLFPLGYLKVGACFPSSSQLNSKLVVVRVQSSGNKQP